ncbi:MAG: spore photoproduct lyase family protein [Thermodesulfobacteriota bacterium]
MTLRPFRLVAEAGQLDTPLGRRLAARLGHVEVRPVLRPRDWGAFGPDDLLLTRHQGDFWKPCPGTRGYNCCGLRILHFGLGCSLDCTYCILQEYLDTRALVLFGNLDQALDELSSRLQDPGFAPRRFCTGEFTDSLFLEELTGLGAKLVALFSRAPGWLLELKTKTDNVGGLLDLDHGGRTIISFSLNAPGPARTEERRAAPLTRRLEAAARAARAGYRLGFHFDPLLLHPGWEEGYERLVGDLFDRVPAERVAWISLGAFRFQPELKEVIRRRHPASHITDQEFVRAADGKMRYLRPIRVSLYQRLVSAIQRAAPGVTLYLCMESPRVWREVFGFDPGTEGLTRMLDARV